MKLPIEDYIARLVAKAPPFSAEQHDRLAGLLKPTATEFETPDLSALEEALQS